MNAFRMTFDETQRWERDGYFVRENVFSYEENDHLRQVAEDIVTGKRRMPMAHIDRNALIRDGKDARSGVYTVCTRSITPVASSRSSSPACAIHA